MATFLSVFVQEIINPFLLIELLIDFYDDDLTRRFWVGNHFLATKHKGKKVLFYLFHTLVYNWSIISLIKFHNSKFIQSNRNK